LRTLCERADCEWSKGGTGKARIYEGDCGYCLQQGAGGIFALAVGKATVTTERNGMGAPD